MFIIYQYNVLQGISVHVGGISVNSEGISVNQGYFGNSMYRRKRAYNISTYTMTAARIRWVRTYIRYIFCSFVNKYVLRCDRQGERSKQLLPLSGINSMQYVHCDFSKWFIDDLKMLMNLTCLFVVVVDIYFLHQWTCYCSKLNSLIGLHVCLLFYLRGGCKSKKISAFSVILCWFSTNCIV